MTQTKTQSQALHDLVESADLVRMIEDLTSPSNIENISSASWSGMRITLRQIREIIARSHNVLAKDLIERSKGAVAASTQSSAGAQAASASGGADRSAAPQTNFTRRDLKASIERYVE